MIAALTGMQDVFKLYSADIYRVTDIDVDGGGRRCGSRRSHPAGRAGTARRAVRGDLSRCGDLDTLVRVTVDGLADLLGITHSQLLLVDEAGDHLFTIASHGYTESGIGAEVPVGEGLVGRAAAQCAPIIIGNLSQMTKYSRSVRHSFEQTGDIGPGHEVPMVGLPRPGSQLAVPALALGQLVGVLLVEDERGERFTQADAVVLTIVTSIVASSIETLRAEVRTAGAVSAGGASASSIVPRAGGCTYATSRSTAARSSTAST